VISMLVERGYALPRIDAWPCGVQP
jgi:hypothetical protein